MVGFFSYLPNGRELCRGRAGFRLFFHAHGRTIRDKFHFFFRYSHCSGGTESQFSHGLGELLTEPLIFVIFNSILHDTERTTLKELSDFKGNILMELV